MVQIHVWLLVGSHATSLMLLMGNGLLVCTLGTKLNNTKVQVTWLIKAFFENNCVLNLIAIGLDSIWCWISPVRASNFFYVLFINPSFGDKIKFLLSKSKKNKNNFIFWINLNKVKKKMIIFQALIKIITPLMILYWGVKENNRFVKKKEK